MSLVVSLPMSLHSQMQGLDLLGNASYVDIPFRLEQGFIIIEARFHNSVNLDFIFDTGAENTLIFDREIPELFGIPYDRRIEVMGSDFSTGLYANIIRNIIFNIKGTRTVLRDVVVLEENILLLEERLGINVDGIIGGTFFRNLVVQINYPKKFIRLYHPEKVNKRIFNKYEKFDIEVFNNKPYLQINTAIKPGQNIDLTFLIDSGASLPFLIHTNTDTMLSLPNTTMLGNLGYGITGILRGYIGLVYHMAIGPFEFKNLITSFQDIEAQSPLDRGIKRNGILGNHMMRRFYVVIDYFNNNAYFRPIRKKRYNKSFDYDRSGMTVFAVGAELNEFLVKDVSPDTPAAEADIRPGDIIYKIAKRRTKGMNLEAVNARLQRKPGRKVKLEIERGGERLKKTIILRDIFAAVKK